jgi:hypothetical protein
MLIVSQGKHDARDPGIVHKSKDCRNERLEFVPR